MFKSLWSAITKAAWIVGLFFVFLLGLYLFRNFVFFYHMSPVLGWSFAAAIFGGMLLLGIYLRVRMAAYPRVLHPPDLPPLSEASHRELKNYCKYLVRYMTRLSKNAELTEDEQELAFEKVQFVSELLRSHPLNDDLRKVIEETEQDVILPLLDALREKAETEVRRSVRDVMLAVTLTPYPSIDLLVVIYRNIAMVLRVVAIYASRPAPREQLLILRDTLSVVVTVNFLNVGRNIIEGLFSQIPLIGRVADDIGQGLGAGFLTSASGHAAMGRCEAFRGWKSEVAVQNLATKSKGFLIDVKNIFTKDVLPNMRGRIRSEVPKTEREEDTSFWESITQGINSAVEGTANAVDGFVLRPAYAGTQKVVAAGTRVTKGVAKAGTSITKATTRSTRSASRGVFRVAKTFGQRLKYTIIRRPR